ncbi:MAG: response regulator transcription factor [Gallionella sp.]|nr:response regulator transcription factor [Gallionella sp.]
MKIRLMAADDHDLIRSGLMQYFEMQQGIEVVAGAADGTELLEKLRFINVDMLLLDMGMPGISGTELISLIKTLYPDMHVLILSAHYDVRTVFDAMKAGASGYICKTCSPKTLLEAIQEVMSIGKYISPDLADQLAYASVSIQSDIDGQQDSANPPRLNGKTIREWKEDCALFYQGKAREETINAGLSGKVVNLENKLFKLEEKIRYIEQQESSDRA